MILIQLFLFLAFLLILFWGAISFFKFLFPNEAEESNLSEKVETQIIPPSALPNDEPFGFRGNNPAPPTRSNKSKMIKLATNFFSVITILGIFYLYSDEIIPLFNNIKVLFSNKLKDLQKSQVIASNSEAIKSNVNASTTSTISVSDKVMEKLGLPTSKERIEEIKKLKKFQSSYKKQMEILKKQ